MSDQSTSENAEEAVTPASETEASETPAPAEKPAAAPARASESDGAAKRSNRRKVREGLVVSTSMDKTAVIAAVDRVRHPRYVKTVQRTKRLYAHDENNETRVGDRVRIAETRPLSKQKRWRLVEILERAK
jgi:small subunit ribosomal protein S17